MLHSREVLHELCDSKVTPIHKLLPTNRKPCCHNIPPPLVGCSLGVSLVSLDNSYIIWSRFGI